LFRAQLPPRLDSPHINSRATALRHHVCQARDLATSRASTDISRAGSAAERMTTAGHGPFAAGRMRDAA